MKLRILSALLVTAVLAAGIARASFVYDHFDDPATSLDLTKWTVTGGGGSYGVSVADSVATLWRDGGSGTWPYVNMTSTSSWLYVTASFKIANDFSAANGFGFSNGTSVISLRNDFSAHYQLNISDGVTNYLSSVDIGTPANGDTFAITWQPNSVYVYKNGIEVDNYTGSLVPAVALNVNIGTYAPDGYGSASYDYVAIPEPSCVVLLTAGLFGLLGSARRKQR